MSNRLKAWLFFKTPVAALLRLLAWPHLRFDRAQREFLFPEEAADPHEAPSTVADFTVSVVKTPSGYYGNGMRRGALRDFAKLQGATAADLQGTAREMRAEFARRYAGNLDGSRKAGSHTWKRLRAVHRCSLFLMCACSVAPLLFRVPDVAVVALCCGSIASALLCTGAIVAMYLADRKVDAARKAARRGLL